MTSHRAEHAIQAYQHGRRRRVAAGAVEAVADAALATGGVLVANATLPLHLGLPGGRAGISLGASLVCAAFAWMTRNRARRNRPQPSRAFTTAASRPAFTAAPAQAVRRAA